MPLKRFPLVSQPFRQSPFGAEYGHAPHWSALAGWLIRRMGVLDLPTRLRARVILPKLKQRDIQEAIDIGFGCGHWTYWLARRSSCRRVIAVDPQSSRIAEAESIVGRLQLSQVELRAGLVPAAICDLPPESADIVLAIEVLQYVGPVEELLDKIRMLLRPGGLLVIHVALLGVARPWEKHQFDPEGLRRMCESRDLPVVHAARTFGPFHRFLFRVFGALADRSRVLGALSFPFLFALTWLAKVENSRGDHLLLVAERPR